MQVVTGVPFNTFLPNVITTMATTTIVVVLTLAHLLTEYGAVVNAILAVRRTLTR